MPLIAAICGYLAVRVSGQAQLKPSVH